MAPARQHLLEPMESYADTLDVKFRMPHVELVPMDPNREKLEAIDGSVRRRLANLALATRKRKFMLSEDFEVIIDRFSDERLNGKLKIPAELNGERLIYDGASIPLPWLVATLSSDILRPLGTVLIPSIVHDYLFERGVIEVEGVEHPVTVERETADKLFLQMFQTVSGLRFWPWIAWMAVRTGSPFIPYAGKTRGWNSQGISVLIAAALLFLLLLSTASWALLIALYAVLPLIKLLDIFVARFTRPFLQHDDHTDKA